MTNDIKKITAPAHQALEGFLIPVIKNVFTIPDYVRLLRLFYGFYKPVEDALEAFAIHEVLSDYEQRRKAQAIMRDLETLNQPSLDAPLCTFIPLIRGREEAFGALYVLEGSTLGGLIIKKILQRNLQQEGEPGFEFFTGYADRTAERWEGFKAVLDTQYKSAEQLHRVCATAVQTFTQLNKWAEMCYQYEPAEEKL